MLLVGAEVVVAPLNRRAQALVAFGGGAVAAVEQFQPVVQARQQLRHRQHRHEPCGELDGQRQPVQARAQRGQHLRVVQPQAELVRPGAVGEELHGALER
ncbi:hypothetical protein [Lentzea kentuckyensis]|uniref:hypothetical protein n=1 Tax=Lentzea kentuckyensis TaxID=360086 RepID=UPI000A3CEF8C|nr:hypothetical protein [Lentzea kentuckyensis]